MSCRFVVSCSTFDVLRGCLELEDVVYIFKFYDIPDYSFYELTVFNVTPEIYRKIYDFVMYQNKRSL